MKTHDLTTGPCDFCGVHAVQCYTSTPVWMLLKPDNEIVGYTATPALHRCPRMTEAELAKTEEELRILARQFDEACAHSLAAGEELIIMRTRLSRLLRGIEWITVSKGTENEWTFCPECRGTKPGTSQTALCVDHSDDCALAKALS